MSISTRAPEADRGTLDRDFALDWYQRWITAWNTHDFRGVQDLVTEDFVLDSPTSRLAGWEVKGREATSDYLRFVLTAYPDMTWELVSPPMFRDDTKQAAFPWRGTGHFTGILNPPGIPGNGNPFEFHGIEWFSFRRGLACHLDVSYDLLGLNRQVGLPGRGKAR